MVENHLRHYFGFDGFKTGQKEVIEKILHGKSAGAIFPTGAGKSLCYQLPAMLLPGMTLVVSPLLSLMKDQLDFLERMKIPAARLDSSLNRVDHVQVLERAKSGELKILMIAPERFRNERFRSQLRQMKVSFMVIDEAHCISEWGHNFRPEYLKLPEYQKEFSIPQILLLTATATTEVRDDMARKFGISPEDIVITGFYRQNLFLQVSPVAEKEKDLFLYKRISEDIHQPTIIYVTLQKTAEHVAEFLQEKGISSYHYHAGMKNDERESLQNRFMNGEINCIVATIAFGMGVDKKDIRRVIHYDLPKSIENYSQEIGRSGRDGKNSLCEILANRDKMNILENFIYGDTPEKQNIYKLLEMIQNTGSVWEVKTYSLSYDLNIRLLPLKTLLVYLDMFHIILPKYTYFEDYSFKYIFPPEKIVACFQEERRAFVSYLFQCCTTKKVWTSLDMSKMIEGYQTDRSRVVTALEYFDEKGWISLSSSKSIDVYEVLDNSFDLNQWTEKIYALFLQKEKHEIERIQNMLDFFATNSCLSKRLASYFGEILEKERCGHCSWCNAGKAEIQKTLELPALSTYSKDFILPKFRQTVQGEFSILNATKFLCGINTPIFRKLKVKKLKNFGIFEEYPFQEVKKWIEG